MRTIFKYPIWVTDTIRLSLPEGAEILTVQVQDGHAYLWAIVDTQVLAQERVIEIFGTGHPMPDAERVYIGTFQQGPFVWHVFERTM